MINWTSYLFSNSKLIYRRKIKIHILIKTIKSITNITILKIMIVWSGKIQLTLSLKNFHNLFANYYFPSSNEIWWSAFSRNSCVPLDAEKKKVKGRQDESSSEGRGGKRRGGGGWMDVRSRGSGSRGLRRARNDASNRSPREKTNLVTKRRKTRKIITFGGN